MEDSGLYRCMRVQLGLMCMVLPQLLSVAYLIPYSTLLVVNDYTPAIVKTSKRKQNIIRTKCWDLVGES